MNQASGPTEDSGGLRADKWLWQARFFKSRSLATQLCQAGKLRLSGFGVVKPPYRVKPGAVLTRSEEHTSELQSLMRISYAGFGLKTTKHQQSRHHYNT